MNLDSTRACAVFFNGNDSLVDETISQMTCLKVVTNDEVQDFSDDAPRRTISLLTLAAVIFTGVLHVLILNSLACTYDLSALLALFMGTAVHHTSHLLHSLCYMYL